MDNHVEEKLAESLTGKGMTEIIPFLPYLLQDLWELGSSPSDILELIRFHQIDAHNLSVLDLGCGKGAISIQLAKALGCKVKGIDLIPAFIDYARQKAEEWEVASLCEFAVGDMNRAVDRESGYGMIIFGAVGSVLGSPPETLMKLKKVLKPQGYIILDDAYLREEQNQPKTKSGYQYPSYADWLNAFSQAGLRRVGEKAADDAALAEINARNNAAIIIRAQELKAAYPDKARLFDDYVKNQHDECDDLTHNIVGVTWLLQCE